MKITKKRIWICAVVFMLCTIKTYAMNNELNNMPSENETSFSNIVISPKLKNIQDINRFFSNSSYEDFANPLFRHALQCPANNFFAA